MPEVHEGLEGVVAFETEIAEPDKEGRRLRYRGVDIEELVGRVPFEKVWGLLIDGAFEPGPAARRALQHPDPHRRRARRRPGRASRCSRRCSAWARPTTSPTSRPASTSPGSR